MNKPSANPSHKASLDALLLPLPGVVPGKMFGYPAYYAGRKLFACVYGDGVGVKVPADVASTLLATRAYIVPFQPMGKPRMREWVQINREDSGDYEQDMDILKMALDHVLGLNKP